MKPKPKKKKLERSEDAIEATLNIRANTEGVMVDFECGDPDCQGHLGEAEELEFNKSNQAEVKPSEEEVECGDCGKKNFNEGFTLTKL
ncbi:MAG: hypothetical protein ACREL1_00340 [bacterium]